MGRLASPHPFLPVRVGTTVSVTGDAWDLHLAAVQDGVILGVLSGGDELPHRWMSSWATKAAKALEQTTVPLPFVVEGSRSTDA